MKTVKKILIPFYVFILGCAPAVQINYSGDSLPPTKHADIFFKFKDVKKEYKVTGEAILKAPMSCDPIKLQDKLVKLAEEKGADAVVITSFKTVSRLSREINPTWGYLTYDPNYIEGPNNMAAADPGTRIPSEDVDPQDEFRYITTYDFIIKSEFIVYEG